jgi:anti-anti-sigma regulatory factor
MRGGIVPQNSTSGEIDVDILAAPPLVKVTGAVDIDAARELRTVLHGLLSMGHGEVDVDLSGVAAIDSCVPEVFAEVSARGLVLHLRNPSLAAQELLHLEAS